jgi:hypothetical protein
MIWMDDQRSQERQISGRNRQSWGIAKAVDKLI